MDALRKLLGLRPAEEILTAISQPCGFTNGAVIGGKGLGGYVLGSFQRDLWRQ